MDIQDTGVGAGIGGFFGMILTLLGIKSKFSDQDKRMDKMEERQVWQDTCIATHKGVDGRLESIEQKIDKILYRVNGG